MIYILSDPIRSGKTTALMSWAKQRDDVNGFLCPDNSKGKRCFINVKSQEEFELETDSETQEIVEIGPFRFLKSTFKKTNDLVINFSSEMEHCYLILDELGKLELRNEGLHGSAEILIPQFIADKKRHLILVVRDYLLDEVIEHYDISEYQILKKEDLKSLL
ncbi:MAG: nucleoside-triphosphatase [Glaciecola sp.]|jgi:nucleoside-triphosphatase THEP1